MKIRNLLLGSLAVAGLSTTGAYAADLGVLTSLDVCDNLGLSGLTISSDTNCLQLSGEVKYRFRWGDFSETAWTARTGAGDVTFYGGDGESDWESRYDTWLKAVGTADSDFGPAKATIKMKAVSNVVSNDNIFPVVVDTGLSTATDDDIVATTDGDNIAGPAGSDTLGHVIIDEAFVSIGDSTIIMAGKKGSIINKGDDEPLNFLGLFNSEAVDLGVFWRFGDSSTDGDGIGDGGHVIQVVSDLGNGVSISAGLENLNAPNLVGGAGTAVGVLAYSGEGISAHITGATAGVLDGDIEAWGVHSGFAGTFDNFKVVLAGAFGHSELSGNDHWNVLASAAATFDMFTLAGSVEAVNDDIVTAGETDLGAGASITAAVTDTVQLNVGGRWYNEADIDNDNFQVAAQVIAAVTETITLTGEVGFVTNDIDGDLFYGSGKVAWAPGGGYTASVAAKATSGTDLVDAGYRFDTEFKKTFE